MTNYGKTAIPSADPADNADSRHPVTVKPLVCDTYGYGQISLATETHGEYRAAPSVAQERIGEWRLRGPWIGFNYYPTLEAAKAAAQADYAARIIAALDPAWMAALEAQLAAADGLMKAYINAADRNHRAWVKMTTDVAAYRAAKEASHE